MSAETATRIKGKPFTQVLRDDTLIRLAAHRQPDLLEWYSLPHEVKLRLALDYFAPVTITSASFSPKKGGRYQIAISTPSGEGATIMLQAADVDEAGL